MLLEGRDGSMGMTLMPLSLLLVDGFGGVEGVSLAGGVALGAELDSEDDEGALDDAVDEDVCTLSTCDIELSDEGDSVMTSAVLYTTSPAVTSFLEAAGAASAVSVVIEVVVDPDPDPVPVVTLANPKLIKVDDKETVVDSL